MNTLPWIDKSFGLSYKHEDGERIIPIIHHKSNDYEEIIPDQNFNHSFVALENDTLNFTDFFEDNTPHAASYNASLIVFVNTNRCYSDQNYRYDENCEIIKADAIKTLKNADTDFEFSEIDEEFEQVFSRFEFGDIPQRYFKAPYFGFKVSGVWKFDVTCDQLFIKRYFERAFAINFA